MHELGVHRIGILGLSFKAGTDDLRESPVIELVRKLWQDGKDIRVYDPDVIPARMLGSNREYLERQLPQINQILLNDLDELILMSEAVVVTQRRKEFVHALVASHSNAVVVDLVRLTRDRDPAQITKYEGISW